MNPDPSDRTQACDEQVWVLSMHRLGTGVFAVNDGREVSLLDRDTLVSLLRQRLEGQQS